MFYIYYTEDIVCLIFLSSQKESVQKENTDSWTYEVQPADFALIDSSSWSDNWDESWFFLLLLCTSMSLTSEAQKDGLRFDLFQTCGLFAFAYT